MTDTPQKFGRTWIMCSVNRSLGGMACNESSFISCYNWGKYDIIADIAQSVARYNNAFGFGHFMTVMGCITKSAGLQEDGLWVWEGEPQRFEENYLLDFSDGEWRRPYLTELENLAKGNSPFMFFDILSLTGPSTWPEAEAHKYQITPGGKIINPAREHSTVEHENRMKMRKTPHPYTTWAAAKDTDCLSCGWHKSSPIHKDHGTSIITEGAAAKLAGLAVPKEVMGDLNTNKATVPVTATNTLPAADRDKPNVQEAGQGRRLAARTQIRVCGEHMALVAKGDFKYGPFKDTFLRVEQVKRTPFDRDCQLCPRGRDKP